MGSDVIMQVYCFEVHIAGRYEIAPRADVGLGHVFYCIVLTGEQHHSCSVHGEDFDCHHIACMLLSVTPHTTLPGCYYVLWQHSRQNFIASDLSLVIAAT